MICSRTLVLPACVLSLLSALPAQRDRTAAAIKAYQEVKGDSESKRRTKVAALGYHSGSAIEKILLAELRAAKTASLKRTVIDALSRSKREMGAGPLVEVLRTSPKDSKIQRSSACGIARQGRDGVDILVKIVTDETAGKKLAAAAKQLRSASLYGLSFADTEVAHRTLAAAFRRSSSTTERRSVIGYLKKAPPSSELTALRLDGARDLDLTTAAACVRQLAEHGHPKAKALILRLHKKSIPGRSRKTPSAAVRTELVYAMAAVLSRDLYHPLIMQFAYSSEGTDKAQKALAKQVAADGKFVRWMTTRGLRLESTSERIVIVRLLGKAIDLPDQENITQTLGKLAKSTDAAVAFTAIRSLGDRADKDAIPLLHRILRSPGDLRRVETVLALHQLSKEDPDWGQVLVGLLRKKDHGLHATALDLLAELGSTAGLEFAFDDMRRRSWPRRAAAYDYCRIVRSTRSIPHLIDRVDVERGRLRVDVLDTLQSLTGFRYQTGALWGQWWDECQMSFELIPAKVPKAKSKAKRSVSKTRTYYNIPMVSERVTFVIDTSGSMNGKIGTGDGTRLDEAKRQLVRVVEAMPKHFRFNIVFFDLRVNALFKVMANANAKSRAHALEVVEAAKPGGATNIFGAMQKAFEDADVDTIYLLSDGYPSAGEITDSTALIAEIERWNRSRQIRIHCIAIGSDSSLLKRIASQSGGEYAHFR